MAIKAREYLAKDAVNVFGGFKRKMGTDEKYYVVNIDDNVTPVDLSALVLKELKKIVPPTESIEAAVITVPASFDSMQSNATLKAGQDAGFKEVFLLQEPIAACLAFFNEATNKEKANGHWLVYDLGGGTFDVALIKSNQDELKIADHEGNNFLGGLDFDFCHH
ncbi:MAG: Hsp70 family protein [Ferruginibacter sp.]